MHKYHIQASANIHASIHQVWRVMTEIEKYPDWNSFVRKINAPVSIPDAGTLMQFEVHFPNGKKATSKEQVKLFNPPALKDGILQAEWIYDFTGFLHSIGMVRASRLQRLIRMEDGTTDYYTIEKFSGWGRIFLPLKNVQDGFLIHAADLKKHCEK